MQMLFKQLAVGLNPRRRWWYFLYRQLDATFRLFDNRRLKIVNHLHLIPPARFRTGGQASLVEFGYSAGFMAAYVGEHLKSENPQVLDLGCGTGKMVSAIWPFLGQAGHYTGLDVSAKAIEFDRKWYPPDKCSFIHVPLTNARYNPRGKPVDGYIIPLSDESIDLATAFSLFTHLNQPDATHYFWEFTRLLKPGAFAILTFFLLETGEESHPGQQWNFNRQIENQPDWWYPDWAQVPEQAIGVTRSGLTALMGSELKLIKIYRGWWHGTPAAFLQDTLVFCKR